MRVANCFSKGLTVSLVAIVLVGCGGDGAGNDGQFVVRADVPSDPNEARSTLGSCEKMDGVETVTAGGESDPPVDLLYSVRGQDKAEAVADCLRGATYAPVDVDSE